MKGHCDCVYLTYDLSVCRTTNARISAKVKIILSCDLYKCTCIICRYHGTFTASWLETIRRRCIMLPCCHHCWVLCVHLIWLHPSFHSNTMTPIPCYLLQFKQKWSNNYSYLPATLLALSKNLLSKVDFA